MADGNNAGSTALTNEVRTYRSLDRDSITLNPGGKVEVSAGKSFAIGDDLVLGASATVYYKNIADYDQTTYDKYFYDLNSKQVYHDSTTNADITTLQTELSGMVNVGAEYFENNKIKYTFFTTQQTSDRTSLSSIDYTGAQEDRQKTYLEYVETGLTSNQLSGVNDLRFSNSTSGYFDNLVIDWAAESSTANRDEPGTVEYNYLYQTSGLNWDRTMFRLQVILKKNWLIYGAEF